MSLRRMVMAQMAQNGAEYLKGTITIPNDGSSYTFNYGKSFGSYMIFLEMTDDSKTAVLNSGSTYARSYSYIGIYPRRSINNTPCESLLAQRYNPSSSTSSYGALTGNQLGTSSLTLPAANITASGWDALVKGLTYNYVIVSLDNI